MMYSCQTYKNAGKRSKHFGDILRIRTKKSGWHRGFRVQNSKSQNSKKIEMTESICCF